MWNPYRISSRREGLAVIEAEAFSWARVAGRPTDLPGPPGRRTLRKSSTGHSTASFFSRSGHRGAVPSERKSRLEIGFDDGKTTQDAIGPAARRPISCGFAGGLIGTACNPLKPWVTSDNSQYVNFYAPVTRKGSTWPATPTPGPPSGYDRRRDTHGDILSITRPGILLPG